MKQGKSQQQAANFFPIFYSFLFRLVFDLFSQLKKPKQEIDDADDNQKQGYELGRRQKGNKRISSVVRAGKFNKEAPNSVPDALYGH